METPKDAHKYLVTYQLKHHPNGIEAQDVPAMHGASDALIVISQLYLEDGSYSQCTSGLDGRTGGDIEPGEMWKAWMILARSLAVEHPNLSPGQRLSAWTAFSLASQMVHGKQPEPPPDLQALLGKLDGLVGYQRNPDGPQVQDTPVPEAPKQGLRVVADPTEDGES